MNIQQGDVLLFQDLEGGNIEINNGLIEMDGGLKTTVYLSLFGGNDDDNKIDNQEFNKSWWGNSNENEINKIRSETQYLLKSLPITSANLRKLELTAQRDLNWMIEINLAKEIKANATIPNINMLKLTIQIDQKEFEFIENWRNQ